MPREESRLKRLLWSSVPSMKVLLNSLDLSLNLPPLEALVLELGLVTRRPLVLLIAMSNRKSRTRAAVVATIRKQTPSMQSPGRRDLTADGQTGLPILSFATCPQLRQSAHKISPSSKAVRLREDC
eukprot:6208414-Pleurochrysis_carterae.AAC.5